MKKSILSPFLALLFFTAGCGADGKPVRSPAVAGQFYPGDVIKLRRALEHFMEDAVPPGGPKPIAIVAPHAGYIYSGQIAADAYKQAAEHSYDVVVILGTNHTTAPFDGVSVYPRGAFRTPLGEIKIDERVTEALMAADKTFANRPENHGREHSVEVQVPFIQYLFPKAQIVPVIVGSPEIGLCTRFGKALAEALEGRDALIVASSDLSHYPDYEDAREVDLQTLEAIASFEPERVKSAMHRPGLGSREGLSTCACGEGPVIAAMIAAKAMGAAHGRLVSYANSGDSPVGDYDRVVGYGAVVFASGDAPKEPYPLMLTSSDSGFVEIEQADRRELLSLARKTVQWYLDSGVAPLPRRFGAAARIPQGAFVTLKKHGELRGCIGHMAEDMPLCRTVAGMSLMAAFEDQRFNPVTEDEMKDIEVEISALTPFKKIPSADSIEIGRDGVVIRKDGRSAVFLPQVATEQGWDRNELLEHLCRKAGLASGSWKKNADLYTFQAIVFSESGR